MSNVVLLHPDVSPNASLLSLFQFPPSFAPTPTHVSHRQILSSVYDFARRLQWRFALPGASNAVPRFGLLSSDRWPPRKLVPRHILYLTRSIISAARSFLRQQHVCFTSSNLSTNQRRELECLATDPSVTVKPADKGGKWTIMRTSDYDKEAFRQLNDTEYYQPYSSDRSKFLKQRLCILLHNLYKRQFITKKELQFLLPQQSQDQRTFYLLPKLHKDTWPELSVPPGRPIVSDVRSISYNCSNLLEYFLSPLVAKQDSYLRDSGHLIAILREASFPQSTLLFTMDVASLYSNIPVDEGIQIVSQLFRQHPDPSRPDRTLLTILELLLTHSAFTFRNSCFLQTKGVAMGKKFAGSFANLFMAHWETKHLQSSPIQPLLWKRYQDDVFGIWPGQLDSLRSFCDHANAVHPSIRLTLAFGTSVNFLDLTVSVQPPSLSYAIYCKPTDTHLLLPPSSHHPRHVTRGVLYGQILRLVTRSSTREAFSTAFCNKSRVWRSQGYSHSLLRQTKLKVLRLTQQLSHWETGTFPCNEPCIACDFLLQRSSVHDSASQNAYPIFSRITCSTTKLIYVASCSNGHLYVGQTDMPFRDRIAQHLSAMHRSPVSAFHEHFHSCDSPANVRFLGIERVLDLDKRLDREKIWIKRLHATLNTQQKRFNNKITLSLPFSHCSRSLCDVIRRKCMPLDETLRTAFRRSRNLRNMFA